MSEKPIDFVYKAHGIEFAGSDVARIIEGKKRRLADLEKCWDSFTRHMECGEIRKLKESCIDDEIEICILSEWLKGIMDARADLPELCIQD